MDRRGAPTDHRSVPAPLHDLARANSARRAGRPDPALERALATATGCDRRLAAYGTLRPGEANHREVADLCGAWRPAWLTGRVEQREYPFLTFDPGAPPIAVALLVSDELPRHWPRLDAFEGADYVRILVPVHTEDGATVLANVYVAADAADGIRT